MEKKLQSIIKRFQDIEAEMSQPDVATNPNRFKELNKEHSQLSSIVQKAEELTSFKQQLEDSNSLLEDENDREMKDMLQLEIEELEEKITKGEEELLIMLLPKDPNSGKDVIMEIRAGTGGDEAALFSADLCRMYTRHADLMGFKWEYLSISETEIGGFKEVTFSVRGDSVYESLKFESGVHRVQRVPSTESGGRIHTSAVTVAVLVEAQENDVEISPDELRIDVYRASGHGGQSVNTTDSAVRITHVPTGIVVTCQDEKSQHKNKAKAMRVLRARLHEKISRERAEKESELRKAQVGSGDRSERIRTYNYPQSRVTDHRINLTLYSLEQVLEGEMGEIIDALKKAEVEKLLSQTE